MAFSAVIIIILVIVSSLWLLIVGSIILIRGIKGRVVVRIRVHWVLQLVGLAKK